MTHDGEYFRRRAAEARSAAVCCEEGEDLEIAGQLALAYTALARRKSVRTTATLPAESERPDA